MSRGRSQTRGRPSAADIQRVLRGIDYPASKREILRAAHRNDADDDILNMLEDMDQDDFGGPQEVEQAIFGDRFNRRSRIDKDERHHVIDFLSEVEEADENGVADVLDDAGYNPSDAGAVLQELEEQGICEENRGRWRLVENQPSQRRRNASYSDDARTYRVDNLDDPDPDRISSHRRANISDEERRRYEERGSRRSRAPVDRRLMEYASDAIADARHMRHGYDGRGRVTNDDSDQRLGDHPSRAIDDARRMRHGYDGRGRVRKFGTPDVQRSYEERRREREASIRRRGD